MYPVADPETRTIRVLSRQCDTCVFGGPGIDTLRLAPGRLASLVRTIRAKRGHLACHSTYAPIAPAGYPAAICRGYADRHADDCDAIIIGRAFGWLREVDPPAKDTTPAERA